MLYEFPKYKIKKKMINNRKKINNYYLFFFFLDFYILGPDDIRLKVHDVECVCGYAFYLYQHENVEIYIPINKRLLSFSKSMYVNLICLVKYTLS